MLDWCGEHDVAVDPVRRRHERRRRRRRAARPGARGRRRASTCARSTACSRSTRSRAPRASRRARPARGSRSSSRAHGLTLRFYPQSFELSTLGGWIATRAGGHFASGPTHIDDLVESVRALDRRRRRVGVAAAAGLGRGAVARPAAARLGGHARRRSPRRGCACCRGRRCAEAATVRFPAFEAGAEAVRAILQAGMRPANCRLVEAEEARADDGRRRLRRTCWCSASRARLPRSSRPRSPSAGGRARPEERGVVASGARRSCARPTCATRSSAMGVLSETFETAITWERLAGVRRRASRAPSREALGPARAASPAASRTPIPTARRPTSPSSRRSARRGGRALGRDQGRRGGRRSSPPAARSPTTTRSAATTGPGTTASGPSRSPPRCGPPRRRSTRAACSTPGYSSTRDEQRQRQEHAGGLPGQGGPRQDLPVGRQGHRGPHGLLRHRAHGLGGGRRHLRPRGRRRLARSRPA